MMKRTMGAIGLAALLITLTGESCLLDQREISVLLDGSIPAEFTSRGFTESSGVDEKTVTGGQEVLDAIESSDTGGTCKTIQLSGAAYRVTANRGHLARRSGMVWIRAAGTPPPGSLLLTYDVPTNAAGTSGSSEGATLGLSPDGVAFVNSRLQQFLTGYNAGSPDASLLDLTFRVSWTSDPPPTASDPDDFDWLVSLVFQVEKTTSLDVPNP